MSGTGKNSELEDRRRKFAQSREKLREIRIEIEAIEHRVEGLRRIATILEQRRRRSN
jgi:hypothetical protein